MKAIINGRILLPDEEVFDKALLFNEKIVGIVDKQSAMRQADEVIDANDNYVSPGFIDVHIHGYKGADASDASQAGIRLMARELLENGITAFLPTTTTIEWETLERIFWQLRELSKESERADYPGAQVLGCHAEGPFINPLRKGALNGDHILRPDPDKFLPYADVVKMITFAPEMGGGENFIRNMKLYSDTVLSIGHTYANYDQTMDAIQQGVDHVTHTFNAMTPMHHRDPGVVGAALTSDVYCELIADTFTVHPGLYPLLVKAKGYKLVLITDCTRGGGLPDGEYTLGGLPIFVKNGECRLADGTIAGSVLKMNQAVYNMRKYGNVPMYQAARMASLNAAESIGVARKKGSLTAGKDADVVIMDPYCKVLKTFVRGRKLYER